MARLLTLLFAIALLCSCHVMESHPYQVKVRYKDINANNIEQIESLCAGKESIKFVWMGDTQRWYDETERFVQSVNERDDIDFVMHGGDISDFGLEREFTWIHKIMRKLKVPYVALIGNHDLLGNGLHIYKAMYGDLNFSFIAGDTKFVCANTNALEFDYSEPVPDFEFLIQQSADSVSRVYQKTVVAIHAQPGDRQFNNNSAGLFQFILNEMKNLQFCMHAHTHRHEVNDYFDDGVLYYSCTSINNRRYLIFTITPDSYEFEEVTF